MLGSLELDEIGQKGVGSKDVDITSFAAGTQPRAGGKYNALKTSPLAQRLTKSRGAKSVIVSQHMSGRCLSLSP